MTDPLPQKDDPYWLREAIRLGRSGMDANEGGPFGALVVKDGQVIGQGHNRVLVSHDPTAHAEVTAIRDACSHLQHHQLNGAVLYTSCEPCPMCLGAIYWARPDRVVYAATREDAARAGFDDALIYREILAEDAARKIPFQHLPLAEALDIFDAWIAKPDKIPY